MKKIRRVLAVFVSVLMVIASVSICAAAAGETGSVTFTLKSSSQTGNNPGDIITVTVNIANNYNATAFRWPIAFSNTVFELVNAGTDKVGNVTGSGALAATGSSLTAIDKSDDERFYNASFAKNRYGMLLIQWIGGQNNGTANYYNEASGTDCLTFQLRVKDNPSAERGVIVIPLGTPYSTYWYRQGISNPTDATTYYKMAESDFSITNTQANLRLNIDVYTLPAGIQAKSGTDIIINNETGNPFGFIYGFTQVAAGEAYPYDENTNDMRQFVETTGGAVAVYTPVEENGEYGTGTYVEVYTGADYAKLQASEEATPFASYYIVIFGDIDGDAYVSGDDVIMHINAINYIYEWTWTINPYDDARYMACDVTADGVVTGDDFGYVVDASNNVGYITQTYSPTTHFVNF